MKITYDDVVGNDSLEYIIACGQSAKCGPYKSTTYDFFFKKILLFYVLHAIDFVVCFATTVMYICI